MVCVFSFRVMAGSWPAPGRGRGVPGASGGNAGAGRARRRVRSGFCLGDAFASALSRLLSLFVCEGMCVKSRVVSACLEIRWSVIFW